MGLDVTQLAQALNQPLNAMIKLPQPVALFVGTDSSSLQKHVMTRLKMTEKDVVKTAKGLLMAGVVLLETTLLSLIVR